MPVEDASLPHQAVPTSLLGVQIADSTHDEDMCFETIQYIKEWSMKTDGPINAKFSTDGVLLYHSLGDTLNASLLSVGLGIL